MKGVSQEAGGVWFALDSEEAASVQCQPSGSQEPPYQAQGHAASALPGRSDSVGQTGEPPVITSQNAHQDRRDLGEVRGAPGPWKGREERSADRGRFVVSPQALIAFLCTSDELR